MRYAAAARRVARPPRGKGTAGWSATVRSGQKLHHGLLLRNITGQELTIATSGQVTAVVVDPQTGQVVGGFAGAQTLVGTYSFRPASWATGSHQVGQSQGVRSCVLFRIL